MQTAHQSSLGSSSLPVPVEVSLSLASAPLSTFPFVSGGPATLLLFSVDSEVVEVIVVLEEHGVVALEQFSPAQGISDWGSVLMRSPRTLAASWPADETPNTGSGLFSGLLIWVKKKKKHFIHV